MKAEEFLSKFIQKDIKYPGIDRAASFLERLDNPQDKVKVIHIAGTSGKGSTAYLISHVLNSLGFRTGLHLSPHLLDVRERCLIDNKIISEKKFDAYLDEIKPFIEKETYFEILVGLAYYIFWKEKVDYAVMETGLGGRYDATNVAKDKLCVITRIGLDHTKVLGDTIEKIAAEKLGIIHKGNIVVALEQEETKELIKKAAENLHFTKVKVKSGLAGDYQKENAGVALKVISVLSERDDFKLDISKIHEALTTAHFKGRFDIRHINGKIVVLDGAHNPQKMAAFIGSLEKEFPNEKFNFLLAFKKGKDFKSMLEHILPLAEKITLTGFFQRQDFSHLSEDSEEVAGCLDELGFKNYVIRENSGKALSSCLKEKDSLVITGSLYLLSEVYQKLKD